MGAVQQLLSSLGGSSQPFGPGPDTISGLQLWLDAYQLVGFSTGDQISTWADKSGNGRDATGVVGTSVKPTYRATDGPNSKPCVRMVQKSDGHGGWFTLPDFLTGLAATSAQAFSVVQIETDPPTDPGFCAPPLGDWGSTGDEYYPYSGDSHIYDAFGSTVRKDTGDPTTSLTNWLVYEERTASGAWSRRINAATSGGDFFSTSTNTVGWGSAPKIARSQTNTKILHGFVAEVIFYNSVLGSTDYGTIKTYLNTKYGFSL